MALLQLLLSCVVVGVVAAEGFLPAPAFVWGRGGFLTGGTGQKQTKTSYQVLPAQSLVDGVVQTLLKPQSNSAASFLDIDALSKAKHDTLVVFIGRQLQTEDLARSGAALQPLRDLLGSAESSLALPYISHLGYEGLATRLTSSLKEHHPNVHQLGYCGKGAAQWVPATAESVQSLLRGKPAEEIEGSGIADTLVVCPEQGASLDREILLLGEVSKAVEGTGRRAVYVYATEPQQEVPRRTSLLETPGLSAGGRNLTYCDAKCRNQVMVLQSVILGVVLLSALLTGTVLMGALSAPSKFETPKEGASGGHH